MSTSVNPKEIEHFAKDSGHWWDEEGPFRPLHMLNPLRLRYIRDRVTAHFNIKDKGPQPLRSLKIVDIGCGGGLVCEPLARLGADVTGLDADQQAIAIARDHAAGAGLDIDYQLSSAELLAARKKGAFDVVLALEIIEHVADVPLFVKNCAALCKPGGLLIFSTLNRTPRSFLLGIVAAEYVLRWVPRGTHDWRKFLRPSELAAALRTAGAETVDIKGLTFNPIENDFKISDKDLAVNYLLTGVKS